MLRTILTSYRLKWEWKAMFLIPVRLEAATYYPSSRIKVKVIINLHLEKYRLE